jgi:hypothetical protein
MKGNGSVRRLWNCLLDRLPGDMETYGPLTYRISEIVGAGVCALCPSKTPAGPPDGLLAKDSAWRSWRTIHRHDGDPRETRPAMMSAMGGLDAFATRFCAKLAIKVGLIDGPADVLQPADPDMP